MSGSDRTDGATDFPDDAAVLVAYGQWAVDPLQSAIRPQVRPQTQVAEMRITASVGSTILGVSRLSRRMSRGP